MADYWDQTQKVEIELRAKRRRRITVDPEVYELNKMYFRVILRLIKTTAE